MLESAPGALANISWPTPAQLSLARAATLSELDRKAEVPGILTHGLSFLYSGSKKNGFAKRESYLQGSIQLLRHLELPPPKELKEAIKELEKVASQTSLDPPENPIDKNAFKNIKS